VTSTADTSGFKAQTAAMEEATKGADKMEVSHRQLHGSVRALAAAAPELGAAFEALALGPVGATLALAEGVRKIVEWEKQLIKTSQEAAAAAAQSFGDMKESINEAADALFKLRESEAEWRAGIERDTGAITSALGEQIETVKEEIEQFKMLAKAQGKDTSGWDTAGLQAEAGLTGRALLGVSEARMAAGKEHEDALAEAAALATPEAKDLPKKLESAKKEADAAKKAAADAQAEADQADQAYQQAFGRGVPKGGEAAAALLAQKRDEVQGRATGADATLSRANQAVQKFEDAVARQTHAQEAAQKHIETSGQTYSTLSKQFDELSGKVEQLNSKLGIQAAGRELNTPEGRLLTEGSQNLDLLAHGAKLSESQIASNREL